VTVRIASYNIRKGGSRRREAIAEVLSALDADVTVLQEATDPEVVGWLARKVGNPFWTSRPDHSVALLARRQPDDVRWHVMGLNRTFIEARLPGHIRLFAVHLSSGLSRRGERRRLGELTEILKVAGDEDDRRRTMILGDFNSIAPGDSLKLASLPRWIRMLLRLDGGIQTEVIAGVRAAGFIDAYRRFEPHDGATLPSVAPVVRLDYVMVGEDLVSAITSCSIAAVSSTLMTTASDHLPLVTVLDTAVPEAATDPIVAGLETSARPGLEREGRPGLEDVDGPIGDAFPPPT
jgi:endonuclease/exonuclease/phosphatase family metal-dependent hydrolase